MNSTFTNWDDTIAALATPQGIGAIGVIRISGKHALAIIDKLFPSKEISQQPSHTLHIGFLKYNDEVMDEVVVSIYKAPKSYTGEDVIEISCHGSPFIQQQILEIIIACGARLAMPGEFTMRAFLNGKFDLTQAEAVADIIAAESEAVRRTALQQMRGGFSSDIKKLREQLIEFAALIELELDFSEEDVEFANRTQLKNLIDEILAAIQKLIESFQLGNILKNGVTAVIAGRPNAGKSTLLNALLNEDRAIVTEIAGTTRDTIEEKLIINGIVFRLIDTAGIREATDVIEKIGIEKTMEKINEASILLYVFDAGASSETEVTEDLQKLKIENQKVLLVANKADTCSKEELANLHDKIKQDASFDYHWFEISALKKVKTEEVKNYLPSLVITEKINANQTIVVNARHYAALQDCEHSIEKVKDGLASNITGDILALDIRHALHALGVITGEILHDRDILGTIFGKFCIGK
ncbi:MAG TPA: tRNA uridine-5-carboxymethylaminomethyl(34) synthesis GTPase MnmE [Chitinophagaceae bacterium]|nr:tRNA uridine-5-carboxymethylaminomethyl(34) synthesis GTPase MnmE [Chitinophagaceae bacterium]